MKRRSRELSSPMAAKILKHDRAEKCHFSNLTVKNQKPFESFYYIAILALHEKSHSLHERDVLIVGRHVKNLTSNFLGFTGI